VILLAPLLDTRLFGPTGAASLHDDRIYFDYASKALAGAVPYRDYVVEYPPLAVPVFLVPRLATARFDVYVMLFAVEMLLFDALAVYLVASYTAMHDGLARVPARLLWYTVFLAALYIVAGSRYDLAPAAVAFAGAVSWFEGRPVLGAALTAAGTLLKIFPAVVAVPAAVSELKATGSSRGLLVFGAAVAAGGVAWFMLGGAASLAYHLERGLQIESTWAGALMLVGKIFGIGLGLRVSHVSTELVAPGASLLASLAIPVQAAMLACVAWQFRRSGAQEPLRYAAAAVLAFIVPGKVLSPQYLVWLIPFIAAIGGTGGCRARWYFTGSCAATALQYLMKAPLFSFQLWAIALLNFRNALLAALFVLLLSGNGTRASAQEVT
jgi:hypothetical protein